MTCQCNCDHEHKLLSENIKEYTFKDHNNKDVKFSELFKDKEDLIVIHNMGKSCPYCTLWADGFIGLQKHLENRAAFVIISPDDVDTQKKFIKSRGWSFQMLSSKNNDFFRDMGFGDNKYPQPGISTFYKDKNNKIIRVGKDDFGPGDKYCSLWHILKLLKDGPNGWEPRYKY